MKLSAKEMTIKEVPLCLDYWYGSSAEFLHGMGADINLLPPRSDFEEMLIHQISLPYEQKKGLATIWFVDDIAVGHNNTNYIQFGDHAQMHLHLWNPDQRQKGMGQALLKKSIPIFFEKLQLKKLYCEPYALNPAPNKTLPKLGFEFVKKYRTIPGNINFEQEVNSYVLRREVFEGWD